LPEGKKMIVPTEAYRMYQKLFMGEEVADEKRN